MGQFTGTLPSWPLISGTTSEDISHGYGTATISGFLVIEGGYNDVNTMLQQRFSDKQQYLTALRHLKMVKQMIFDSRGSFTIPYCLAQDALLLLEYRRGVYQRCDGTFFFNLHLAKWPLSIGVNEAELFERLSHRRYLRGNSLSLTGKSHQLAFFPGNGRLA